MKSWKIASWFGIVLTILAFAIYFLMEKHFSTTFLLLEYKSLRGIKGFEGTVLFDDNQQLIEAAFSFTKGISIAGIEGSDSPNDVIKKLGKPDFRGESITKYLYIPKKKREAMTFFKEFVPDMEFRTLSLVYLRDGGIVQANFINGKLWLLSFKGGNPPLPYGIKMGMRVQELEDILGNGERHFPRHNPGGKRLESWMLPIINAFWPILFYSLLRRKKENFNKFWFFFLAWLILCFVDLGINEAFPFFSALSQGLVSFGFLLSLMLAFAYPSFLSGTALLALLILLELFPSHWKLNWRVLLIALYIIFVALWGWLIPFPFYERPFSFAITHVITPNLRSLLYSIGEKALFIIWFYILCLTNSKAGKI